jgi:hypothetical protein
LPPGSSLNTRAVVRRKTVCAFVQVRGSMRADYSGAYGEKQIRLTNRGMVGWSINHCSSME